MEVIYKFDKKYPHNFSFLKDAPIKIYAMGNVELLNKLSFSIVGSRRCSEYGEKVTQRFTKEIISLGLVTVSGMANGVDTIVHETSIKNNGETIAVLPSGFDNIYPKENKELYKKIIENKGLAISEYEPHEIADSKKFIRRNRLVSALGECLIVTEAAYRSGTSITARFAKEQGKKVFCVPSGIDNRCGIGTNKMIKSGHSLLTGISDIFDEVESEKLEAYKEKYNKELIMNMNIKNIPKECKKVYDVIWDRPTSIDYIFNKTTETIADISYKLTILELEGFIKSIPGGFYEKKYL